MKIRNIFFTELKAEKKLNFHLQTMETVRIPTTLDTSQARPLASLMSPVCMANLNNIRNR